MIATVLDLLRERADEIERDGVRLLKEFSCIHRAPSYRSVVVISPSGDHYWDDLPEPGKQIQASLLPKLERFSNLVTSVSENLPASTRKDLDSKLKLLHSSIEQGGGTWWESKDEAVHEFRKLLTETIEIVKSFCNSSPSEFIAVPDTNALLKNIELEKWTLPDIQRFTILLVPAILAELDSHKVNHRVDTVREKSNKLITRIKEYRRRGSLHEGVPIVKNKIYIRTIAQEPNTSKGLPWFDPKNPDDRFLTSVLEIMRINLNSSVFVVTADINMLNKADVAGIPCHDFD